MAVLAIRAGRFCVCDYLHGSCVRSFTFAIWRYANYLSIEWYGRSVVRYSNYVLRGALLFSSLVIVWRWLDKRYNIEFVMLNHSASVSVVLSSSVDGVAMAGLVREDGGVGWPIGVSFFDACAFCFFPIDVSIQSPFAVLFAFARCIARGSHYGFRSLPFWLWGGVSLGASVFRWPFGASVSGVGGFSSMGFFDWGDRDLPSCIRGRVRLPWCCWD